MKSRFENIKGIGKLADALTHAISGRSGLTKEEKVELAVVRDRLNLFLAKVLKNGLPR